MFDLDFLLQLSLAPLGFIGLLGGLMGGMMKGGGGGKPSQAPSATPQASKAVADPVQPQAPEQEQTKAETQSAEPVQEAAQPKVTEGLLSDVDQPAQVAAAEKVNVTDGLLDPVDPIADPKPTQKGEPIEAPDVVNKTDTDTPVAQQQSEMLGKTPMLEKTDTLANRVFDAGTNEQNFQYQEGMQARQVDTGDAENPSMGYQYKQGSTVAGGLPRQRYGVRV
jgi:hypothetical protein